MVENKAVFIFGAGASKDFGLPVMSGFCDQLRRIEGDSDLTSEVREDFSAVCGYLDGLQSLAVPSIDPTNMEEVFCLWQMEKEIGKPGASDKLTSLIRAIAYTFERSHDRGERKRIPGPWVHEDRGYVRLLRSLARLLSQSRMSDQWSAFTFITTNYDLALEDAWLSETYYGDLRSVAKRYHKERFTGEFGMFTKKCQKAIAEEFEETCTAYRPMTARYGLMNRRNHDITCYPLLLKLHGSLNWGICRACGNVQEFPLPLADPRSTTGLRVLDGMLGKPCAWHPETTWGDAEQAKEYCYQPLLIPPSWSKTGESPELRNLWRQAVDQLASARRLVFVGYSMPETDVHLRYLLAAGLAQRAVPPLLLVNWSEDEAEADRVKNRYEGILDIQFDGRPHTYLRRRFADAVGDIEAFLCA